MPTKPSIDSRDSSLDAAPEVFGWLCDNALHELSLTSDRAARTDALSQVEVESAWQLAWLALDLASAPANSLPELKQGTEIAWPTEMAEGLRTQPLVPQLPAAAWQQLRRAREQGLFARLPTRQTWSTQLPVQAREFLARELAGALAARDYATLAARVTNELIEQLHAVLCACARFIVRQRPNNDGTTLEATSALREILRLLASFEQPRGAQGSMTPPQQKPGAPESIAFGRPTAAPPAAMPAVALDGSGSTPSATPAAPRARVPEAVSGGDDVQFTVFRPKQLAAERWSKLLAFAHLAQRRPDAPADSPDPLAQVQQQARALLGSEISKYRQLSEDAGQPIAFEGQLTFIPEVPDVKFDPPRASVLWVDDVQRVEFRMRPAAALAGNTARGRLSVFCGSILVADLQLSLPVTASESSVSQTFAAPETARMYRKIFASYSHKDASIVEQFRELAKAFGDRYLIDVSDLRAGERWSEALEKLIREADVFQLFWSWSSMRSEFVRREWEYALQLGRESFVRPTYWEQPMPELPSEGLPPPSLAALQFQPLSLLNKSAPAYAAPHDDAGLTLEERSNPVAKSASSKGRSSWLRRVVPLSSFIVIGAALLVVLNTVNAPSKSSAPPASVTEHVEPPDVSGPGILNVPIRAPREQLAPPPLPTHPEPAAAPEPPAATKPSPDTTPITPKQPPKKATTRFPNAEAAKRAFDANEIDEREYTEALKELEAARLRVLKPKPRGAVRVP